MAQTPDSRTPVSVLFQLSDYHDEALALHPGDGHARCRERNRAATAQLETAYDAYVATLRALARPRARVVHADREADRVVDLLDLDAKRADGGKPAAVHAAIFPQGKSVIVEPVGPSEVVALRALENRLRPLTHPVAVEGLPKVTAVRERYEAALADRAAARDACAAARAVLADARRVFVESYVQNQGALRELHPRDRRAFESFFDVYRSSRRASDEEPTDPGTPSPA